MNNEELRKLQMVELNILDEFVGICKKNHLRYYLNAGTLLGAIRHQGFIPWDDDIDVCMPRSDYEQFLTIVKQKLPKNMRAVCFRFQEANEHPQYSCQIVDLNIPIIQKIAETPRETFAWIDVFPLDGMPKNGVLRKLHGIHLLYRRAMLQFSMFDKNVNMKKTGRPIYEKMLIWFCRKINLGKRLNPFKEMDKLDRVLRKYPDGKNLLVVNFMGAYKLKETFPFSYYGQGNEYEFEGRRLRGPEKADKILTILYGDYMTPRPPTNEEGHNLILQDKEFTTL